MAQSHPLDHREHRRALRRVLFHEFQPGGGVEKQVPDHDGRAQRTARLLHRARHAALQGQGRAERGLQGAGEDRDAGDSGNRGQGLPPEAQGADGLQVVFGFQLAGGVAQEGGGQLVGGDALSVVGDPEKGHAAMGNFHRDGSCACVDGVFHQLLGYGGRAFDYFPGGD